jgi:protein-S-isoprenylcysteine O-methyltransferase Ste14
MGVKPRRRNSGTTKRAVWPYAPKSATARAADEGAEVVISNLALPLGRVLVEQRLEARIFAQRIPRRIEARGNRWVIAVFAVIGLVNAYLPAYTDRKELWTIDSDTIRWLGVGLFAAGGALRIWPVFVLGKRFSGLVAIQPGHTLVTNGVYGVIRHPSYLGLLINSLGWSLAYRSGVGVLLTVLLIPPLLSRISAEENLLRTQFGDEYKAYCSHTSRLIPGIY